MAFVETTSIDTKLSMVHRRARHMTALVNPLDAPKDILATGTASASDIVSSLMHAYSDRKVPLQFKADVHRPGKINGERAELDVIITTVGYTRESFGFFNLEFTVIDDPDWVAGSAFYNSNTGHARLELRAAP